MKERLTCCLEYLNSPNALWFLVVFSVGLKLLLLMVLGIQSFPDGNGYLHIATTIYENGFIYPDSAQTDAPLTPYLYAIFSPLSSLFGPAGIALSNVLLATFLVYLVYWITYEIFTNQRAALLAACATAIYPFFNFYVITFLTEILYLTLLYSFFLMFIRFLKYKKGYHLILASVLLAAASLTRFPTLFMAPFFFVLLLVLLYVQKEKMLMLFRTAIVSLGAFVIAMLPWWVHNYHLYDKVVLTSEGISDFAFYIGNNPLNQTGGGISGVDYDLSDYEKMEDVELANELAQQDAVNWIVNHPGDWLVLELKKFVRFYRVTLHAPQYQQWYYKAMSIMSYGVVLLFFLVGLWQYLRRSFYLLSPMVLYLVLLSGVHMLLFASVRYRLPLEPFMIVVASMAIINIVERFSDERS